jgi:hypothetical protein
MLKLSGAVLAAGVLFGVGQRVSQWLLPAPPLEVAVCLPSSEGEPEGCLLLDAAVSDVLPGTSEFERPITQSL